MRTHKDRLRHTLLFECILLAICIPFLSWVLKQPASHIGRLSAMLSLAAMGWNYLYNLLFDHGLKRLGKRFYPRSLPLRIIHACLFELGLLFATIPGVMYWMNYSLLQALALDLSFLLMVPVYTVMFNGCYDKIFPVPTLQTD
ncbi:MAG: PACE efflux transporter [Desulfobacterium sp.]|nr:PACE efflux transporter [Desulfobacterium sp.]